MTWGKAFVTFLALAILNYSVSPSVFAMGEEERRAAAGGQRGTLSEEQDYAQCEASSGELADFVGGQDTTGVAFDPLLVILGVVLFVGLIFLLLQGMEDSGGGGYTPPPPPESYSQSAVRNMSLKVLVSWNFQFTPADPNGAGVWANETAPAELVAALNRLGQADGNSFYLSTDGGCNVNLHVYEYTDGNTVTPHNSLRGEMWALGHRDMVCSVSTASTADRDEGVDDLANRLYSWIHNGWKK